MNEPAASLPRTVLLCGAGGSSPIVARRLDAISELAAIICEPRPSRSLLIRRRAARLGWPRVLDQLAFQAAVAPLLERAARRRKQEILTRYRLDEQWPYAPNRVDRADSDDALRIIQIAAPDLIVLSGTRILSAAFLRQLSIPVVNIHAGITPAYRGVHGGYWALRKGDPQRCGVTLHRVDAGIDTGAIIDQAQIPLAPDDTFATYPLLQLGEGLKLLERHLPAIAAGNAPVQLPQDGRSGLYVHPELSTWLKGWWYYGVR